MPAAMAPGRANGLYVVVVGVDAGENGAHEEALDSSLVTFTRALTTALVVVHCELVSLVSLLFVVTVFGVSEMNWETRS